MNLVSRHERGKIFCVNVGLWSYFIITDYLLTLLIETQGILKCLGIIKIRLGPRSVFNQSLLAKKLKFLLQTTVDLKERRKHCSRESCQF